MEDLMVLRLIAGFLPVHLPLFWHDVPVPSVGPEDSRTHQYQNQLLPAFLYLNH